LEKKNRSALHAKAKKQESLCLHAVSSAKVAAAKQPGHPHLLRHAADVQPQAVQVAGIDET